MNKPFNHNQGTPNLAKINVNLRFGKKKKKKKLNLTIVKEKNKNKNFKRQLINKLSIRSTLNF